MIGGEYDASLAGYCTSTSTLSIINAKEVFWFLPFLKKMAFLALKKHVRYGIV